MTPMVKTAVRGFDLDPTQFTWMDLSETWAYRPKDYRDQAEKIGVRGPFRSATDIPLPFDSIAVVTPKENSNLVYTLSRTESGLVFTMNALTGARLAEVQTDAVTSYTGRRYWFEELVETQLMQQASEGETILNVLDAIENDAIRDVLYAAAGFYGPQSASNPVRRKPAKGHKADKPLYDWHTVTLAPRPPKQEPKGGTHASPRPHDRRGHYRTYKSGKQVWVSNMRVGRGEGFVFKDYVAKGEK
jgi:hypothetical protein